MSFTLRSLDASTWDAFAELVERLPDFARQAQLAGLA